MSPSKKIAVFGSSVAAGWVTSLETQYDMKNGYVARLSRLLADRGWEVHSYCIPGDTTAGVLSRIEDPLIELKPDIALIGLSMSNEGLETDDPDAVYEKYKTGLKNIMEICQRSSAIPVIGLCYSNDNFSESQYEYLKKMNCDIQSWGVACINFLGGFNDGFGHFPENHTFEGDHPDNLGHEELFYTCVPGLFDALIEKKNYPPQRLGRTQFTVVPGNSHFTYIPNDIIHSFSMVFSIKTQNAGIIGSICSPTSKHSFLISEAGKLQYRDITSPQTISDNLWHQIVLTHHFIPGKSILYINGQEAGTQAEQIEPVEFMIGARQPDTAPEMFYCQNLMVYRSALSELEVQSLNDGLLQPASLEVFAPLDTHSFIGEEVVLNLAQSDSLLIPTMENTDLQRKKLIQKISQASIGRENQKIFKDKEPVAADPGKFPDYIGQYQISPDDGFIVTLKNDQLIFIDRGQEIPLWPEATDTFFIKYPGELTITFNRDDSGSVIELLLNMNGQKVPARKNL